MGIIRRTRPQGPRNLVHKHVYRLLRTEKANDDALAPGFQKLGSYLIPGLQAGPHLITIKQSIQTLPDDRKDEQGNYLGEKRDISTTQKFDAINARFKLPENSIQSVYPLQGHAEKAQILPHVVFNEATFPWEREGPLDEGADRGSLADRCRTPWLAVFAFTEEELKLDNATLRSIVKADPVLHPNFAASLTMDQLKNLMPAIAPVTLRPAPNDAGPVDVIFLGKDLFSGLFTKYTDKGAPDPGWANKPYVYHHSLLAHRRDVNNKGMAVSSAATEDDTDSFGVIFSHRTGPYSVTKPTTLYVHLVSIEGIEKISPWPMDPSIQFVALPTLLSWSYVCLPPNAPDVEQEFQTLGANISVLRPPYPGEQRQDSVSTDPKSEPPAGPIRVKIVDRIKNGYSLSRYRTQTGEGTVCFTRGPFVPADIKKFQPPPPLPEWWKTTSMSGTDLQILDRDLAIMDITYSAAWQLGRVLAIADQAFTSALFRTRREILDRALIVVHEIYSIQQQKHYKSKFSLLRSLPDTMNRLGALPSGDGLSQDGAMQKRWLKPAAESLDLSYTSIGVQSQLDAAILQAAQDIACAPKADDPTQPDRDQPYNEYNNPYSVDWVVVLRWMLDRLFLGSVPAHVLFTPEAIPGETIRFFKIDKTWMDCFMDGALSLGNHVDQQDDVVRKGIKAAFNLYLDKEVASLGFKPPVPKYGCLIRSVLVKKFPDLIVTTWPEVQPRSPPILVRHELLDDGTMLCLFSQPPTAGVFESLTLAQPPHQQCFTAAIELSPTLFQTSYRKAFTNPPEKYDPQDVSKPLIDPPSWSNPAPEHPMYLWDNGNTSKPTELRSILVENLCEDYRQKLGLKMGTNPKNQKPYFEDSSISSALWAYKCNDPSWELVINLPKSHLSAENPSTALPVHWRTPPAPPPAPKFEQLNPKLGLVTPDDRAHFRTKAPVIDLAHPPPWHHRIPTLPMPDLSSGDRKDSSDLPVYIYNCWEASNPGTLSAPQPIPMNTGVAQDIVFSIVLKLGYSYTLKSIVFLIPIGTPTERRSTLCSAYNGHGAAMLSNLRFNPLVSYSDEEHALQIELRPRSSDPKGVKMAVCGELGFLLSGVEVSDNSVVGAALRVGGKKDGNVLLPMKVWENYDTLEKHLIDDPVPAMVFEDQKEN